jgi:ribonuclease E
VTKPGNSDPAEPTADEAPEPTVASTEAADGTPELPTTSAEDPASPPPSSHESPTRAPGGPPNSTLPESTDNSGSSDSGSSDATAEDGTGATAESAGAEPAEAAAAKPSAKAESAEPAPAAAKRVPKARAESAAADEEPEPLMAELERAPLPPNAEVLRAQAKRRFEEPPPRMLRFSFYFFTAAGLVWLGSMVLSLFYKQQIIDAQVKANKDPKITPEQLAGAVNQILWIVTIAALAFTIFLALFGYKATEGARRGRTLVTIFAAILVIFHVFLNGTQLGILSALFGLVGLGLLWAPSSRAYFPPRELR